MIAARKGDDRFDVLVVCTGNVCRSPVAEQVLRARFGEQYVRFSSAGTFALVGQEMPAQAQELARRLGGTTAGPHYPRLIEQALIERADLVLALTREHRSEIVRMLPRANRYTVTLREAARLLESLVKGPSNAQDNARLRALPLPDALRELVPRMMAERGFAAPPSAPDADDVVDPYRRPQETYDESGSQILDAVNRIEAALRLFGQRQ